MSYYRTIHTTGEIRKWSGAIDLRKEYPLLRLRSKRSLKQLPDKRDELCRQNTRDRSWKKFRKTQYKIKPQPKTKNPRPKISYDSPMVYFGWPLNYGIPRSTCWSHW